MLNFTEPAARWFLTSSDRLINLMQVTDIKFFRDGGSLSFATVYQSVADSDGQASITLDQADAKRLWNGFS